MLNQAEVLTEIQDFNENIKIMKTFNFPTSKVNSLSSNPIVDRLNSREFRSRFLRRWRCGYEGRNKWGNSLGCILSTRNGINFKMPLELLQYHYACN